MSDDSTLLTREYSGLHRNGCAFVYRAVDPQPPVCVDIIKPGFRRGESRAWHDVSIQFNADTNERGELAIGDVRRSPPFRERWIYECEGLRFSAVWQFGMRLSRFTEAEIPIERRDELFPDLTFGDDPMVWICELEVTEC